MESNARLEIEMEKLLPEDLVNIYKVFCRSYGFIWNDKELNYLRNEGVDTITKVEIGGPITQRNVLVSSPGGYNHFMGIRIKSENSSSLRFVFGAYKQSNMDKKRNLKRLLFREELKKLFPGKVIDTF